MTLFKPPTYERHIPLSVTGGPRVKLDQGISIVRVSGVLRLLYGPSPEQLTAAGREGVDWFIGGHVYDVSPATLSELQAGGFA